MKITVKCFACKTNDIIIDVLYVSGDKSSVDVRAVCNKCSGIKTKGRSRGSRTRRSNNVTHSGQVANSPESITIVEGNRITVPEIINTDDFAEGVNYDFGANDEDSSNAEDNNTN